MSEEKYSSKIFREKALARVRSPEQLNSYIRVVNPGVWVALGAILALLIGAVIWCSVITLETATVKAAATVKNGEMTLYFRADSDTKVTEGMTLHIGENDFLLPDTEINGVKLYAQTDSAIMELLDTDGSEYAYYTKFYTDLPNGIYAASIVTSDISPFELIFN